MSISHAHLNSLGSFPIQCPNCRKIGEFSLIYTNLSLGPFGLSVYPLHRRVAAVCPGCTKLYYLKKETASRILFKKTVAITKEDLLDAADSAQSSAEDFGKFSKRND